MSVIIAKNAIFLSLRVISMRITGIPVRTTINEYIEYNNSPVIAMVARGCVESAEKKCPFRRKLNALVAPQVGQGNPVA